MDDINEQLKKSFGRLHDWLPELQQPYFYAQIGALDQSIVVGEHSVGISLDKYLVRNIRSTRNSIQPSSVLPCSASISCPTASPSIC